MAERSATQAWLEAQRAELQHQIKVSYSVGRRDYLKLLLNQEDISALLRSLTYHALFQKHRVREMKTLHQEVLRITKAERAIDLEISSLSRLQEQKSTAWEALKRSRAERVSLLAKLGEEIDNNSDTLKRLQLDEEKLERLLSGLSEELADVSSEESEAFASLKGRLPWPTRGRLLNRFGTPRSSMGLSWQGVLIDAEPGRPVHAISHGRVAFADWLRGFGLLLIIDHGDGYMSLYGRNESLFKDVGDWVRTGEQVSVVGAIAGEEKPALYFEIRHNGQPRNPVKWCQGNHPLTADGLAGG